MAIKCQSCRIPGIFPVPYSVCRIQMLYCKFNNKYKSFPELTAKARPQHTHIHTEAKAALILQLYFRLCLALLGFLTSSVRTRDTCAVPAKTDALMAMGRHP